MRWSWSPPNSFRITAIFGTGTIVPGFGKPIVPWWFGNACGRSRPSPTILIVLKTRYEQQRQVNVLMASTSETPHPSLLFERMPDIPRTQSLDSSSPSSLQLQILDKKRCLDGPPRSRILFRTLPPRSCSWRAGQVFCACVLRNDADTRAIMSRRCGARIEDLPPYLGTQPGWSSVLNPRIQIPIITE
jgi:hypothetical protein